MLSQTRYAIRSALFMVLWTTALTALGKEDSFTLSCPIGFTLIYKKEKEIPFCVKKKGPETFSDAYKDCVGNLYTTKLYRELEISKPDYRVWTEYRTLYPGGVFIDWSHTRSMGQPGHFILKDDIVFEPGLDLDGDLCLVLDPVRNFTAVKCHTRHYRYCVVKPYVASMTKKDCEGLKDSYRFWSPVSTCLTVLTGVGGGAVRATWTQASELCGKKGGYLLSHGWRYSNYSEFRHANNANHTYPLGIVMNTDHSSLRYDALTDHSEVISFIT